MWIYQCTVPKKHEIIRLRRVPPVYRDGPPFLTPTHPTCPLPGLDFLSNTTHFLGAQPQLVPRCTDQHTTQIGTKGIVNWRTNGLVAKRMFHVVRSDVALREIILQPTNCPFTFDSLSLIIPSTVLFLLFLLLFITDQFLLLLSQLKCHERGTPSRITMKYIPFSEVYSTLSATMFRDQFPCTPFWAIIWANIRAGSSLGNTFQYHFLNSYSCISFY